MKWNIDALREKQHEIARKVTLTNHLPEWNLLRTVGGADVSFNRFSKIGFAAIVVLSLPDLQVIETSSVEQRLELPYIPGYLAFREWPFIHQCLKNLSIRPQALICDGHGIAHPRRAGLASHVGVEEDIITIGCAKSVFVGEYMEPDSQRGSISNLILKEEKIGEVVRTKNNVKPLFISPGHKIDFHTATQLILSLCRRYRLPEPIREAHALVNRIRIEHICRVE